MSLDNPTQLLTSHDLIQLRTLQQAVTTATTVAAAASSSNQLRQLVTGNNFNQQQQPQSTNNMHIVSSGLESSTTTVSSPASASVVSNTNTNNLNNLLAAVSKATLNSVAASSSSIAAPSCASVSINAAAMPSTSKYVFLQQNRNGQFTAYDGTATSAHSNSGQHNIKGATPTGNIVLLAAEPLEGGSTSLDHLQQTTHHHIHPTHAHIQLQNQHNVITSQSPASASAANDNDEELHSLTWLHSNNLIKEIVTTTTASSHTSGSHISSNSSTNSPNNGKRALFSSSNICIVNASNAHELIEELPHHVANEEQVIATNGSPISAGLVATELPPETQITTLSVSDFQQQFKRFSSSELKDAKSSHTVYGSIAALGATTTVHVGPSGTTTVVEYKAGTNFLPTRHILSNSNGVGSLTQLSATNLSNSNSSLVPSSAIQSLSSSPATTTAIASASLAGNNTATTTVLVATGSKQLTLPTATSIVANGSNGTGGVVTNSNHQATITTNNSNSNTTNTYYQGHKIHHQQLQQNNGVPNLTPTSTTTTTTTHSSSSTTHHPHKKYLREKMNVLDQGGGGGGVVISSSLSPSSSNNSATTAPPSSSVSSASSSTLSISTAIGSTITVVSSPASSNTSLSSSLSTAAINGGNSPPLSKPSYFTLSGSSTPIALNYSSSNSSTTAPFLAVSSTNTSTCAMSPTALSTTGIPPGYTLVSHPALPIVTNSQISAVSAQQQQQHQQQHQQHQQHNIVVSSPTLMVSPEIQTQPQITTKEYYTLSTPQQLQHHFQQQQQQQAMRSPTSYSSYDNDSLKDFEISNSNSNISSQRINGSTHLQQQQQQQQNHQQQQQQQQQQSPLTPKSTSSSSLNTNTNNSGGSNIMATPQKQKHANKVPYDPLVHTHNKPPYSFSSLIFMAIEGSQEKALPVKEIYAWIVQHFPYFKTAPNGWKNSVRHNLSLNKSFVKVEKAPNMGKGSLWRVEQQQRQNLIQALNRSPFFQNSSADKISLKSPGGTMLFSQGYDVIDGSKSSTTSSSSHINSRFDPNLFPNLSKAFKDISDVVPDVPDDEYPSDYSTSKLINNQSANHNTKYISLGSIVGLSNDKVVIGGGDSAGDSNNPNNNNNSSSVMGAFSNYESIELLARDCGADSIDDVNAATAMLALKHGPKVFAETFQNGAPVITSSPSEDHTYSAGGSGGGGGGSTAGSGSSTPLINGSSSTNLGGHGQTTTSHQGCTDNQSNCASSDAAYESSEECHNATPEELEDQQRQRDGVDALLSLSLSSGIDTSSTTTNSQNSSLSSNSPIKRPPSTTVEEEHNISNMDRQSVSSNYHAVPQAQNLSKMALLSTAAANLSYVAINGNGRHAATSNGSTLLDEGYNTQSYFGSASSSSNGNHSINGHHHNNHHHHYGGGGGGHNLHHSLALTKKPKTLRSLRTKIKRKAPWMR